jgi:hypothetical protein
MAGHINLLVTWNFDFKVGGDAHLVAGGGEMGGDFFVDGMHVFGFVGCAWEVGWRHFLGLSCSGWSGEVAVGERERGFWDGPMRGRCGCQDTNCGDLLCGGELIVYHSMKYRYRSARVDAYVAFI